MKTIEKISCILLASFSIYVLYYSTVELPTIVESQKISLAELSILNENKIKYPEFMALRINSLMADGIISYKEFKKTIRELKEYEEFLMYESLKDNRENK